MRFAVAFGTNVTVISDYRLDRRIHIGSSEQRGRFDHIDEFIDDNVAVTRQVGFACTCWYLFEKLVVSLDPANDEMQPCFHAASAGS